VIVNVNVRENLIVVVVVLVVTARVVNRSK